MTDRRLAFRSPLVSLLLTVMLLQAVSLAKNETTQGMSPADSSSPSIDVQGTWSGTFYSKHQNTAPFTMTVVINPDSRGHLIGSSTLNSDCLKGAHLQVTVTGSNVVLAGADEEGDSITVRGTVDSTGTLLKGNYILNGSASGRCETDDGTGSLAKR